MNCCGGIINARRTSLPVISPVLVTLTRDDEKKSFVPLRIFSRKITLFFCFRSSRETWTNGSLSLKRAVRLDNSHLELCHSIVSMTDLDSFQLFLSVHHRRIESIHSIRGKNHITMHTFRRFFSKENSGDVASKKEHLRRRTTLQTGTTFPFENSGAHRSLLHSSSSVQSNYWTIFSSQTRSKIDEYFDIRVKKRHWTFLLHLIKDNQMEANDWETRGNSLNSDEWRVLFIDQIKFWSLQTPIFFRPFSMKNVKEYC